MPLVPLLILNLVFLGRCLPVQMLLVQSQILSLAQANPGCGMLELLIP